MKNKKIIGVTVASALCLALCGGALIGCGDDEPEKLTDEALAATKIADFTTGDAADRKAVFATDGFENGDVFNTWWNKENVSYDNNLAELSISEMTEKKQVYNPDYDADAAAEDPDYDVPEKIDCQANYYGGEMRTSEYYGYGDYEVRMKPSNVKGTASTFFVCTGPYDVNYETGEKNKHDEIDIEFLGKDTTRVQFNYFVDGKGGHEYMYNLGFDASKEFHTYGFRWAEECIVWFVDGQPVYKVKATKNNPMPTTAGRILTNYWTGTEKAESWMGKLPEDYSAKAQYEYIATSAEAQPDPTVAPPAPPAEVPEEGWTDISTAGFDGWGMYDVLKEDGINISHTVEKGDYKDQYKCCGMDIASDYSWVKFKVTNNSNTDGAVIRLDIKKKGATESDNGIGGIVDVVSQHEGVSLLKSDSAALIKLAKGESADVVCRISDDVVVNQFVVFLNSSNGATAEAGNITITELKGIVAEASEEPSVDPVEVAKISIGENVTFTGDGYAITPSEDKTSMTLGYDGVVGNSYCNIYGYIADIIGDSNTVTFTLKNNGSASANIRMDVKCPEKAVYDVANGTYCNLNATYEGNVEASGNNYPYGGGDWVQIAAGETVTVTIKFKTGVGADALSFYVDSSTWDDESSHTGNVTISDITLWKA